MFVSLLPMYKQVSLNNYIYIYMYLECYIYIYIYIQVLDGAKGSGTSFNPEPGVKATGSGRRRGEGSRLPAPPLRVFHFVRFVEEPWLWQCSLPLASYTRKKL